jgi:hypothetical protein
MVDAVLNHFGLANRLLDEKPELFITRELPHNEQDKIKAIWQRLSAERDPEVREAARMTLNTLHFIVEEEEVGWREFFNPKSQKLSEAITGLIKRQYPDSDKKEQIHAVVNQVLRPFLEIDGVYGETRPAYDMAKMAEGAPVPHWFFRIQSDGHGSVRGSMFKHGSDQGFGESSWTNTVQLDWQNNVDAVRALVVNMLSTWVDKYGVDGFRLDAAHYVSLANLIAIREALTKKHPDKKLEFIVETYDPTMVAKSGMKAYRFDAINALFDFVNYGSKENLLRLLRWGSLSNGVVLASNHDSAQSNLTLTNRFQGDRAAAARKAGIVRFLLMTAGAGLTYINGDDAYNTSAKLMKFDRGAWQRDGISNYFRALELRLETLAVDYPLICNTSQFVFETSNPNVAAGAKWDDDTMVIWSAEAKTDDSEQYGRIAPEQLAQLNTLLPSTTRIDKDAMYLLRDLVTGVVYKEISGTDILEQGISLFLSKATKRDGEWIASPQEQRTPPFQILQLDRVRQFAPEEEARIRSLRDGIVTVGDASGYVCGKDEKFIYVLMAKHRVIKDGRVPEHVVLDVHFNNGNWGRGSVLNAGEEAQAGSVDPTDIARDIVLVRVPVNTLFPSLDVARSADESTEPTSKQRMTALSIRVLLTAEQSPEPESKVLLVSGRHHPTVWYSKSIGLTDFTAGDHTISQHLALPTPVDEPDRVPKVQPGDSGSPGIYRGKVVGLLIGPHTNINGKSYTAFVPAEIITDYLARYMPESAHIKAEAVPPIVDERDLYERTQPLQTLAGRNRLIQQSDSLLPANYARAVAAALKLGAKALTVDRYITRIEWRPSMLAAFNIGAFIGQHGENTNGARKLVARTRWGLGLGAAAGVALAFISGFIVFPFLGILGSHVATVIAAMLVIGSATNFIVHMQIDYVVSKNLVAATAQYRNARIENGNVEYTVFIVNTPPPNIDSLNPIPITITDDGKQVWGVVTPAGQIVWYSEASSEQVTRAITERTHDIDGMLGDTRLEERLRKFFISSLSTRTDASAALLIKATQQAVCGTAVRIETETVGKRITYDQDGTIVLTGDMSSILPSVRNASSGDAVAMRNSILLYINSKFDINKTVRALIHLNEKQIVVDGIEKAAAVQSALKMNRLQVYAMIDQAEIQRAFKSGIAGAVIRSPDGREIKVIDFATANPADLVNDSVPASLIDTANKSVDVIKTDIRSLRNNSLLVLDVSQLAQWIDEVRDMTDKQSLINLIDSTSILSLFSTRSYSVRFIRDAVYGFSEDQLTETTKSAYLAKMQADLERESERYTTLAIEFNQAWEQRLKADAWIKKKDYKFSIPVNHRQMIGRALSLLPAEFSQVDVTADINETSEAGIREKYREVLKDPTAKTVSELLALIELFDMQFINVTDQPLQPQDIRTITSILSAA